MIPLLLSRGYGAQFNAVLSILGRLFDTGFQIGG